MADIKLTLGVDAGEFIKSVKKAQDSLKTLSNSSKNFGKNAETGFGKATSAFEVFKGVVAADVVVSSIKSLSGAIVDLGTNFIKQASNIEDITSRFTTLTGSVDNAQALVKDLNEFAANTPFQLSGLSEATQQLLSFGFEQDQILDKLQNIGDVAAATGNDVSELSTIFGQISAAGKLTGERFNQLVERGVNIGPALAESMGVAESGVRDLVSQGKVGFAEFEKAFQSLSKEGGIAFEGMARQSKTLSGLISTLQDNFTLVAAEIGDALLPHVKEVVAEIINFTQENKALIKSGVLKFISGSIKAFSKLVRAVAFAEKAFDGLKLVLLDVFIFSQKVDKAILEFTEATINSAVSLAESAVKIVAKPFEVLLESIRSIISRSNSLLGTSFQVPDALNLAIDKLEGVNLDNLKVDFSKEIADLESIAKFAEADAKALLLADSSAEKFAEKLEQISADIGTFNDTPIQEKQVSIKPVVRRSGGGILEEGDIREELLSVEDALLDIDLELETKIVPETSQLDAVLSQTKEFAVSIGDTFLSAFTSKDGEEGAKKLVTGTFTAAAGAIGTAFGVAGIDKIAGPIFEVLSRGPEAAKKFITELVENVPVIIDAIVESIPAVVVALAKHSPSIAIALARAMAIEVPKALIEGLVQTMNEVFFPEVEKGLNIVGEGFQFHRKQLEEGATFHKDQLESAGTNFLNGVKEIGPILKEFFSGFGDALLDAASRLGEFLKNVFVVGPLEKLVEGLNALGEALNLDIDIDLDSIGENLSQALSKAFTAITDPIRGFVNGFIDVINNLKVPALRGTIKNPFGKDVNFNVFDTFDLIPGDIPKLATGGFVTGAGVRDTVPALLTPGEVVIDRSTGPKLMEFLNGQGSGNTETIALLGQILNRLDQPQMAQVQLNLDGNVLADEILELNTNRARLER